MKIIDLSHRMDHGMPVFPGSENPAFNRRNDFPNQAYREMELKMSSHLGTHMDAPAHMIKNGMFLDDFDISHFTGKAVKINLNDFEKNRTIPAGIDYILFETGWSKHWGNPSYFSNFQCLSSESIQFLLDKNLKGLGVDCISFDPVESTTYSNHYSLLGNNMVLIENLCCLEKIDTGYIFDFHCFPLHINKADGSPIRAVAVVY